MLNIQKTSQSRRSSSRRNARKKFSLFVVISGLLVVAGIAAGLFVALRPENLKIAVGPAGSDDLRLIQGAAQAFARERNHIRLLPIVTAGAGESVAQLGEAKADLAVTRADLELPKDAQSVAVLRKNVVVLWVPSGQATKGAKRPATPKIKNIENLAGHRVGIVGQSEANAKLLRIILTGSGVPSEKVGIVQYGVNQIGELARDQTVDAYLAVGPLDSKITAEAINATVKLRGEPLFLAIDVADTIAQKNPIYQAAEIPGSIFNASPARPDDKVDTLSVDHLIVARKSLSEATVSALTRQLFADRQALLKEFPGIASIEKPDTDKDAAIPAHRGAAAFIDGTERTFVERYSDFFWGGLLLLSGLGSAGAWLRGYWKRDEKANNAMLRKRALDMIAQAREGSSLEELHRMQTEVDAVLEDTLQCYEDGAIEEGDLSAFSLVLEQFHYAVEDRRARLHIKPTENIEELQHPL